MIPDLRARMPIGAALTIGRKGPRGNPIETDRFFIVQTRDVNGVRPLHPAFRAFNELEDVEKRKSIRGNLIYAAQADCYTSQLRAQVLPGRTAHPNMRPHCRCDDGATAHRWTGPGADDFIELPCAGAQCEFRVPPGPDKPTPCKPDLRFYFQPNWPAGNPLPTPAMKLTSGSWNNAGTFKGFFDYIREQARCLGATEYSLYGLPFILTLAKKKRKDGDDRRAFPVLDIAHDCNLQAFLVRQAGDWKLLGETQRRPQIEDRASVIDADYTAHQPGVHTTGADEEEGS